MHNNIMAAGSRDRPPMLATGRYAQWQSRFMRYVDTKPNGVNLKKCILQDPYKLSNLIILEAEAIHLILTGIGDDIYSTIDNFKTAHDIYGESIESYYSKFYKMMNEMVRNQLEVATMQVNVQFLQQLQPEWSIFVTVVKQIIELDKESYHKLFDILKQYKKEVNEIYAEKIARNANPLALVVRTVTGAEAKEIVGSQVLQLTGIQCFNYKESGHFAKECRKPKGQKITLITRIRCCYANKLRKPLEKLQYDADYNVFANERQHSEQPKSINDAYVVEKGDSNIIPDSSNMCLLHDKEVELVKYKTYKDCTIENDTLERKLKETLGLLAQKKNDTKEVLKLKAYEISVVKEKNDELISYDKDDLANIFAPDREETLTLEQEGRSKLNKEKIPLALKTQNDGFIFVNELKQEMFTDLQYVQSLEKEIDELESDKADFSNIYDLLLQEWVSKDVIQECECLAKKLSKQTKNVSKEVYNELSQSFAKLEKHSISLELSLQQCQEQIKNETVCKEKASTVFLKEREQYFEIQDLKAQLQDKNISISELKKIIEKCKGKSMEIKFDKPSVVRQPNAQSIPKPSVLGKPTPFSDSLERKSF
ncbi:retrovirus-related pol polyprotein from transposon TNT 1-94 [Tanacetum coccineum]